jgi:hypothetical protein
MFPLPSFGFSDQIIHKILAAKIIAHSAGQVDKDIEKGYIYYA